MDELSDILKNRNYDEPSEIVELKKYIYQKYEVKVSPKIENGKIILTVNNASLANSLRLNLIAVKEVCHIEKKVIIRIGDF